MKIRRLFKPQVLKQIGRNLLVAFLAHFAEELEGGLAIASAPRLTDEEYYAAVLHWMMSVEDLPVALAEALMVVDELATARGQEVLESALERAGINIKFAPESTPAEIAIQAWLTAPELVTRQYNQRRLCRLSAFEYYGSIFSSGRPTQIPAPNSTDLKALTAALDPWFEQHNRGEQTTRVELYAIDGEYWFLVRHGDTFAHRPKVEQQKTELLHFRPERDDVIVYSPEHIEIRINARTKGEKELYRQSFGLVFFGDADFFRAMRTYTLEPLRTDGVAALDPEGLDGILKITLREVQVACGNSMQNVITTESADIFASGAQAEDALHAIPEDGQLTRAEFELHFADSFKSASVQVRPPNVLKLSSHCDARKVGNWLAKRGFRALGNQPLESLFWV